MNRVSSPAQPARLVIAGGHRLEGEVTLSGAKNAALPILAASLLADGPCTLRRVPVNADIDTLCQILDQLGVTITREPNGVIRTECTGPIDAEPDENLVRAMRGSICLLGPLLARRRPVRLALPGGCMIGPRPVNLHLKALRALGAEVNVRHGQIVARARRLRGARMYLGGSFGSSVLATANALTAAVLAEGCTTIEHAAVEPEIEDLTRFLMAMGARIRGVGSHRLIVDGVKRLRGTDYTIMPDRIEAGTFMAAVAAAGGNILIRGIRDDHLGAVLDRLAAAGVTLVAQRRGLRVCAQRRPLAVDITTWPYPGFPTDLQAPFLAVQAISKGVSVVMDKVFPKRFRHAEELARMGADIAFENGAVRVRGVESLTGACMEASDLRAAAALVIAGLAAEGVTEITGLQHLDRGYERLVEKLRGLGARIEYIGQIAARPAKARLAG